MIKAAIEKILDLSVPVINEIDNKKYSQKKLIEVKPEPGPMPGNMTVNTLSGVVDYIKGNLDDEKDHVIHIGDYDFVKLFGSYDPEFCRRKEYIIAKSELKRFLFGNWYDHESFIISMLSFFKQTGEGNDFEKLMAYLNKMSVEKGVSLKDDGITQQASVKTGVVSLAAQDVPNPVSLYPYETFPEIEEMKRSFVFRVRESRNGGIECVLFESGDTRWKLSYIKAIKEYFMAQLNGIKNKVSIIA